MVQCLHLEKQTNSLGLSLLPLLWLTKPQIHSEFSEYSPSLTFLVLFSNKCKGYGNLGDIVFGDEILSVPPKLKCHQHECCRIRIFKRSWTWGFPLKHDPWCLYSSSVGLMYFEYNGFAWSIPLIGFQVDAYPIISTRLAANERAIIETPPLMSFSFYSQIEGKEISFWSIKIFKFWHFGRN